jgi:sulfate adenylyltransferase subunit 1
MADLLRLATAGSVDDGKSTLVGRLLHDSRSVLADQLAAVERTSRERGQDAVDLALLTDGLRAEREQGITIDVAYRYFATGRRSFILADTPGHLQYTRNMVTGASTAQVVVILVDARTGISEQTRRHATVAALLRVPHLVLAVNKMDLVGYSQEVFDGIAADFAKHVGALGHNDITAVPISALNGENVVTPASSMPWHPGPTLLEHLETVSVGYEAETLPFRFPVQIVLRPGAGEHRDYRGYGGQVTSGVVRLGDEIVVQPSGLTSRVTAIDGLHGPLFEARAPMSITIRIGDDLDISRGDLLADITSPGRVARDLDGIVCWLGDRPLQPGARILLRAATRTVPALVSRVAGRLDVTTLAWEEADRLRLNDIGRIEVRAADPVTVDDYLDDRHTGGFLLIDPADGGTLAAGMTGDPLSVVVPGRSQRQDYATTRAS